MDKAKYEAAIIEAVTRLQGCKATELASEPTLLGIKNLPDFLEDMILKGKLVEVEYVLPNMRYRIKSFLLPANTEVKGKEKEKQTRSLQCQTCGSSNISEHYGGPGGLW